MSEICSACRRKKSIYDLRIPGSCLEHVFCTTCYDSQSKYEFIEISNCFDCKDFFKPDPLNSIDCCSYCLGSKPFFKNICQSHRICEICISSPCDQKIKSCYNCLEQWENTCCNCFKYLKSGILSYPRHMVHKYCSDCINQDFIACQECSKVNTMPSQILCFVCKETSNIFYQNNCTQHCFCVNCLIILQDLRYSEIYPEFYKCDVCIKSIQKIFYQDYCSLCLSNINLFKIFTCPKKHNFCEDCLTRKKNISPYLRCNYCIEYFNPVYENFYCIICSKSRKNHKLLACEKHYACDYCLSNIPLGKLDLYLRVLRCGNCSKSIEQLFKNKHLNLKFVLSYHKNDSCMICDKNFSISKSCSDHKICIKCYSKRLKIIYNQNCLQCLDLMNLLCYSCFEIKEDEALLYLNLSCSQLHRYCINCFLYYKVSIFSKSCRFCLQMYEFINSQTCIFCKKDIKIGLRYTCAYHYMCDKCAGFLNDDNKLLYSSVLNCKECKDSINNTKFPKKANDIENIEEVKIPLNEMNKRANIDDTKNQKTESNLINEQSLQNKNLILYGNSSISNTACNDPSYPKEILNLHDDSKIIDDIDKKLFLKESARNLSFLLAEKSKKTDELSPDSIIPIDAHQKYECCCREQEYKLECGHSLCSFCLEECFKKSYKIFIENIINRRLDILNSESGGINCFDPECYCKMLIPFSLFYDVAKEVVLFYRLEDKFVQHYELYFEGIRYKFESFQCCGYITGYIYDRNCMWCAKNSNSW